MEEQIKNKMLTNYNFCWLKFVLINHKNDFHISHLTNFEIHFQFFVIKNLHWINMLNYEQREELISTERILHPPA